MNGKPPSRNSKAYWLDDPKNVDKVYWSVIVTCAVLFLLDAFYEKHPEFAMEKIFGFYGLYGFIACVGLVLAAKEMRKFLKRDEDYYDREGRD
jgi:hypothetical protein